MIRSIELKKSVTADWKEAATASNQSMRILNTIKMVNRAIFAKDRWRSNNIEPGLKSDNLGWVRVTVRVR